MALKSHFNKERVIPQHTLPWKKKGVTFHSEKKLLFYSNFRPVINASWKIRGNPKMTSLL
jgi:hypothetical protein